MITYCVEMFFLSNYLSIACRININSRDAYIMRSLSPTLQVIFAASDCEEYWDYNWLVYVQKNTGLCGDFCNSLVLVLQDLIKVTVALVCIIALSQCVPLKLDITDGTHTCLQMAPKRFNQLKGKAFIHESCCGWQMLVRIKH